MNLEALDLNLLVALDALLAEGSVGGAARRVGLSQPAMSHALGRLRTVFGDPLLVRVGARMQLTLRAESVRGPLGDVLEQVRGVLRDGAFDPTSSTRVFRVLMSDYASGVVLPPLLARLRREARRVRVDVAPWPGRHGDLFAAARTADLALTCDPETPAGFRRRRLFVDRDVCAVRRGHPGVRRLSSVAGLLAADHVAVAEKEFPEDPVDTWLREQSRSRRIAALVPNYLQALHLVAHTDLVAVVPERLVRACAKALGLRSFDVPLDAGTFDEYLLHPTRNESDAGCSWFRGVVEGVADGLGPLQKPKAPATRRRPGSLSAAMRMRR